MTFSIIARSSNHDLFGMAIVSSSPAVGARCAHGRAGVGVVATQNITDPGLAPRVLDALQGGLDDNDKATAFFRALQPLGFKLVPKKAHIEVIVIDHLEKPSAN